MVRKEPHNLMIVYLNLNSLPLKLSHRENWIFDCVFVYQSLTGVQSSLDREGVQNG